MSDNNTSDSYEVGFGKPPRSTQFRKGVSGNPKGRPKKALEFFAELIREAKSLITINDNGRRTRISKAQGIAKQVTNKALTGDISALKIFFGSYQQALERATLLEAAQASNLERYKDVKALTREELMRIAAAGLKDKE